MASTSSPTTKTKKSAATPAVKAAAPKAAKTASAARPAAPRKSRSSAPAGAVSPDQRRQYIEVAAYYIAERRGFQVGAEMDDWVQAESEIDRLLAESKLSA